MTILDLYVGLDYHDDSVRVCVVNSEGRVLANRDRGNNVELVAEFIDGFGLPKSIAIEACCGAADFASELSRRYGWEVRMAHPGYVSRLKQSPDKSDYDDAELLADLLRVNYLPEVWLAPEETRQLRRLARYRQGLAQQRKRIKQQIRAILREERLKCDSANPWTKPWMDWVRREAKLGEHARWVMDEQLTCLTEIEEKIGRVEQRFEEATQGDPLMQELLAQPGVGLVTAFVMRAEIGSFHRFRSGKQLSRFCSLTPLKAARGKRMPDWFARPTQSYGAFLSKRLSASAATTINGKRQNKGFVIAVNPPMSPLQQSRIAGSDGCIIKSRKTFQRKTPLLWTCQRSQENDMRVKPRRSQRGPAFAKVGSSATWAGR